MYTHVHRLMCMACACRHAQRNFVLAAAALAGHALQLGPHPEAAHAAISNLTHSVLGHHTAMLEEDGRWSALYDEAHEAARTLWGRMHWDSKEAWLVHHHQVSTRQHP